MSGEIILYHSDPRIRKVLVDFLTDEGYKLSIVDRADDIISRVNSDDNYVVLSELQGGGSDGSIKLMESAHGINSNIPFVFVATGDDVKEAVRAMKAGAFYCLTEPIDLGELKVVLERVFEDIKLRQENIVLKDKAYGRFHNMIGKSEAMQRVYEIIKQVAPTDVSVLITGESGVGKELVAEAIHAFSRRRDAPLVKLHCAALAEGVLESELFGHEKGAFTDALKRHIGRFEKADGGTLFLDEVSEIPPSVQVKILRVLEDGRFERVGGSETLKTDIRLITATNKNLVREVEEGRFREDLYWRIKVIEIYIPPLRERRDDIPLLIDHYLEVYSNKNHRPLSKVEKKAMDLLVSYDWPGNVRELKNVVESIVVLSRDDIVTVDDLPEDVRYGVSKGGPLMIPVGTSIEEVEKSLIRDTLLKVANDKKKAAKMLGISLGQLERRIRRYGL